MSDSPSPSKAEILAQLQASIGQLQSVVQKLETEADISPNLEPSVTSLTALSRQLAQSVSPESSSGTAKMQAPVGESAERLMAIAEEDMNGIDRILPEFEKVESGWDWVLAKVRRILPRSLNQKLSDWGLTSVLAGIVITVLLSSVLLISQQPARITPELTASETTEGFSSPDETIAIAEKPTELTDQIPAPLDLEAPAEPEVIELAPPLELPLTPEQSLLGAIQQEVKDLTRQYPDGLIIAIAPNFDSNRLTLTLADSWFELTPKRQIMLVDGLYKRSQRLTFQKVFIQDSQGNLLARSPVVGSEMIIVQSKSQDQNNLTNGE